MSAAATLRGPQPRDAGRRAEPSPREPRAAIGARSAMRKLPVPSRLVRLAIALVALTALPALADEYKIGVIHVERILQQSAAAKAAHDRIEQEFKARDADLSRKEQDVRAASADLEKARATLAAEEFASRERTLETRSRDVQRLRQQFAEDLRARQFEELDKLKERLDKVLTRYAKEQNFDLILQDAAFVGHSVDITDDIIKALAASP
jgi:outer membrane protein